MSFLLPPPSILAAPLVAMDLVVLDTETTGLDVRRDRVIELAGVWVRAGKVREDETFSSLIDPGVEITRDSTAIHGIRPEDVAGAPAFPEVMEQFAAWAGPNVIGGFMTGFDLAILKAEHERHEMKWSQPLALDVRTLAKLCAPELPDESLETLAAWLKIEISGRHRALPDAVSAARMFTALLPRLKARGIITLGQAMKVARELRAQAMATAREDMAALMPEPPKTLGPRRAIDSYPFRNRVRDVMSAEVATIDGAASLGAAMRRMLERRVSSLFIPPDDRAAEWGILTERDILRAIAAHGEGALKRMVHDHASRPLVAVAENEFIYRAIARMAELGLRHLAVRRRTDDAIIGAITQGDLLRYRTLQALMMGDRLRKAQSPQELARLWPTLIDVARAMQTDNATPNEIAAVISRELRSLSLRACQLAKQSMIEDGHGEPPRDFGVMLLGSAGRGESLLAMDQDNALIYEGAADARADEWFAEFGRRFNDILNEAGVPHCPGEVMVRNARWRKSEQDWLRTARTWVREAAPEDLLHVAIFFDFRRAYGDRDLVRRLRQQCLDMARESQPLHSFLALEAARFDSPIGWFGRLRTEEGRVDLKKGGLMPIFSAARVLALKLGSRKRSTPARLREAIEAEICPPHAARDLIEAHRILLGLVLEQQLRDIERGIAPSNKVAVNELNRYQRDEMRWALERVQAVPSILGVPAHLVS